MDVVSNHFFSNESDRLVLICLHVGNKCQQRGHNRTISVYSRRVLRCAGRPSSPAQSSVVHSAGRALGRAGTPGASTRPSCQIRRVKLESKNWREWSNRCLAPSSDSIQVFTRTVKPCQSLGGDTYNISEPMFSMSIWISIFFVASSYTV